MEQVLAYLKQYPLFPICIILLLVIGTGCPRQSRLDKADNLATSAHLQSIVFHTDLFAIQGYQRIKPCATSLVVYLEGDGAAWINRHTIASDPTPKEPTALQLAALDPADNILYLARPCQYLPGPTCTKKYWTSHRYSPEIRQAINQAITEVTDRYPITRITIIGYSGGGVLASLIATRRKDVTRIITIAANLDIDFWTNLHNVTPLWGSENPCTYGEKLQHIPQTHIIGGNDDIVPVEVIQSYLHCLPTKLNTTITVIPNLDHHSRWEKQWSEILTRIRAGTIPPNGL